MEDKARHSRQCVVEAEALSFLKTVKLALSGQRILK